MASVANLAELLLRWEELAERGQPVTVEELCRDRPELAEPLRRRLAELEALDAFFRVPEAKLAATEAATPGKEGGPAGGPLVPGYEILEEVGRGGMGVVYKARQVRLNRFVALKMILAGGHAGREERARFRSEAEAVARFQHPHIVQIYDIGDADSGPYIALEFVAGGSLADQLDGTPWHSERAATLTRTLALAMQAAHEAGIVHRDLKPANILLAGDGTPKIGDFGLAKWLDRAAGPTGQSAVVGTPSYIAPEQADRSLGEIGPATDIYALGVILYELLTGRPPFRAATLLETVRQVVSEEPVPPARLQPGTPRDLDTVCLKCLAKDPRARYRAAAALAEDLGRFLRGEATQARPLGPARRALRWAKRKPAQAALLAVSAVAAAMLLVVSLVYNAGLQAERDGATRAAERERDAKQLAEKREEEARTAKQEAENALARSRQHLALNYVAYGRICALAARLAAASSRHEVQEEETEFRNLSEWLALVGDKSVRPSLEQYQEGLREWREGKPPADLEQKALKLAHACKQSWLPEVQITLPGAGEEIRSRLYTRACAVADRLAMADDWKDVKRSHREFWELYWGELAIVESAEVARAMVEFGNCLKEWREGPPPLELRDLARDLRAACVQP